MLPHIIRKWPLKWGAVWMSMMQWQQFEQQSGSRARQSRRGHRGRHGCWQCGDGGDAASLMRMLPSPSAVRMGRRRCWCEVLQQVEIWAQWALAQCFWQCNSSPPGSWQRPPKFSPKVWFWAPDLQPSCRKIRVAVSLVETRPCTCKCYKNNNHTDAKLGYWENPPTIHFTNSFPKPETLNHIVCAYCLENFWRLWQCFSWTWMSSCEGNGWLG